MTGKKIFKKGLRLSRKNKWLQFFYEPLGVIKLFFFTRIAKLLGKPIKWQAKLFWGDKVVGYFPEPTFNSLYLYHFIEAPLTNTVLKYVKPGMKFIDIGPHVGYYTILASQLVGEKGKVFAFEPTPATFELLFENVRSFPNVSIENSAVWSKDGMLDFLDYGNFYAACNSYTVARMSPGILKKVRPKKIKVCTIRLDGYFGSLKIRPDFVKIDAESAEYEVLLGMRQILAKDKPVIALEIGDEQKAVGKTQKCIQLLAAYGYKAFEWVDGKLIPFTPKDSYLNLYDNLLFLPK